MSGEAIKVVVRVRPMNTKEKDRGCSNIIQLDQANNQISIVKPDQQDNIKDFAFDSVFGQDSLQQTVYLKSAFNLVQNVLLGYNGTIFAYGQTGCGKTHSMVGKVESEELQGIIPRSFGHILKTISQTSHKQFLIRCSFIEIYNEEVRDLLSKDVKCKLQLKQSPDKGVFIKDLLINQAKTHDDLMGFMSLGNKNRSVGQTAMNKDSSRSHLLFMLFLQSAQIAQGKQQRKYVASKLNLVDLAGSQRLSKTGASGDRLKQAQKINLSLSALGNVISALVDGKTNHIPYRDSKLTRLLQDSLGGNTKTVMIANCSPADYNFDQTLSTLRYASRAKFIKNKPKINEDPKDALLKQYAEQIKRLKARLQGDGIALPENIPNTQYHEQMNAKLRQKQNELSNEKLQKQKLLQRIKALQNHHLQGKDVHISETTKKNVERVSLMNHEIELTKSQQPKMKPKTPDDEIEQIDKATNTNTKELIEKYKNLLKKQKRKVKNLENQLKDINHENYQDKEGILEDVRDLTKENKLLQGIINILLLPNELETIKQSAQYSQEKQDYKIPPFYMKNRSIIFPKLQYNQSMEMIRQMQEGRKILWEKEELKQDQTLRQNNNIFNVSQCSLKNQKKGDIGIRDVIRQARTQQNNFSTYKQEKRNPRKLQLDPIKKQES